MYGAGGKIRSMNAPHPMLKLLLLTLIALGVLATPFRVASACPNCSEAIGASDTDGGAPTGGGSLARGFYVSILAMLAILGSVGVFLVRTLIRVARESDEAGQAQVQAARARHASPQPAP